MVSLVSTSPCFCVLYVKYFALLGLMWARARNSSPSTRKMAQNGCFMARWASFFAEMRLKGPCGASFFVYQQSWDPVGRVCELKGSRARDAFTETEVGLGWLVAYVDRLFARG